MLTECQELMQLYPLAPDMDNPAIEMLKTYIEAAKEHHERVLSLAECLLPELRSLLNDVKQITRELPANTSNNSYGENDSQTSFRR